MEHATSRRTRRLEGGKALIASVLLVACGAPAPVGPGSGSPATGTTPTGTAPPGTPPATTATAGATLLDGYTLPVPPGWSGQDRAVIGTAFQQDARCVSAETVDRPVPSDAGSPELNRAAVQLCVITRDDDLTLDQWLAGRSQRTSTPERYGTCDVRVLPGTPQRQLAYAQSPGRRAEIAVTVTMTPEKAQQRLREVADLLTKMRCPPL